MLNKFQQFIINSFLKIVRTAYKFGWKRGWFKLSAKMAVLLPQTSSQTIFVQYLGNLVVDFKESMCFPAINNEFAKTAEANLLPKILCEGDIVYDIGANYGCVSLYMSGLVGGKGRVISFEPSGVALRLLRMNAAMKSNITVFEVALGEKKGREKLYTANNVAMSSFILSDSRIAIRAVDEVSVCALDELVVENLLPLPNVIKCDVEGAELKVFTGAKATIATGPIILFEYIDDLAKPYRYILNDLLEALLSYMPPETQVYRVSDNGEILGSLSAYEGSSNNYLMIPPKYLERICK